MHIHLFSALTANIWDQGANTDMTTAPLSHPWLVVGWCCKSPHDTTMSSLLMQPYEYFLEIQSPKNTRNAVEHQKWMYNTAQPHRWKAQQFYQQDDHIRWKCHPCLCYADNIRTITYKLMAKWHRMRTSDYLSVSSKQYTWPLWGCTLTDYTNFTPISESIRGVCLWNVSVMSPLTEIR